MFYKQTGHPKMASIASRETQFSLSSNGEIQTIMYFAAIHIYNVNGNKRGTNGKGILGNFPLSYCVDNV